MVSSNNKASLTMWCSLLAILAGIAVLLGWVFDLQHVKSIFPGFVAMNPLTAICFVLAGLSLGLQSVFMADQFRSRIGQGLSLILIAISAIKISDYLFSMKMEPDRFLFRESLGDNFMAPNTAICFLLTGLSLLFLDWITVRGKWPAQIPAVGLATFALVSLIGYGYGAMSMYRVHTYIPMALNTALVFQLLSVGILISRPGRGVGSILLHHGLGGMMARRLLPVGVLIPCLLGWLRVLGQQAGLYETEFGAAFMVAITVIIFSMAICWIAAVLNHTDEQRQSYAQDLIRSNQEIRDLYDNAPCGYHSLDANGVYIAINKTELDWLGYRIDEVLGKLSFADVITPAGRQRFAEKYAEFKDAGKVNDLEFDLVCKDGQTLPVIVNATAITDSDGNYVASRTTVYDATERRRVVNTIRIFNAELEKRVADRTDELKVANAELQEKNQENAMFVYSVSHDLRSPLVNLQGFSQELTSVSGQVRDLLFSSKFPADVEKQVSQLIDDDMQRCIRFIQTSVGRLSGIIDSLLRLSRAGRVEFAPQLVDLDQVVDRVVEAMSSVASDRGVTIEVHPLPATWGDPTAVEQIFANLIGNAVNYLDPQRPGQIEVGCMPSEADSSSSTYFIKDNGLGIPEAYHGKVFQALKRLHPKIAEGEGIGLALVKRTVDRHGGTISFESCAGEGTTFYVTLPNPAGDTKRPIESVTLPTPTGNHHACQTA